MKKILFCLSISLIIVATVSCKKKKEEEPVAGAVSPQPTFHYKVNGVVYASTISFAQTASGYTIIYGGDHLSGGQVMPPAISFYLPPITGPKVFSLDTVSTGWQPDDSTYYSSYQGNLNVTEYNRVASGTFFFDAVTYTSSGMDTVHITEGTFANLTVVN
jgi:hypothetical protein